MSVFQQEDFPFAFAEIKEHCQQIDGNTVFYVEWLDNSSEFPDLAPPTNTNLTDGNWELLQRKEMIEDEQEHTVVPVEDAWSKVISVEDQPLYADIVEKNAAELQPTTRTLQPLWPIDQLKKKLQKETTESNDDVDDLYDGDLGAELLQDHKNQSRRTYRLSRRRKLHDWREVDYHIEGILRLTTTTGGWTRSPTPDDVVEMLNGKPTAHFIGIISESQAKRYATRLSHNYKTYSFGHSRCRTGNTNEDHGENSVLERITKRQ